jgi:hypothetical protein
VPDVLYLLKKMKRILLLMLLTSFLAQSQSWQWIKEGGSTENLSSRQEEVYSIVTDSEKNSYVLSRVGRSSLLIDGNPKTAYENFSPNETVIVSFTCDGVYRWSKIIGGGGTEQINSIQIDSEDNVYVAGRMGTCDGGGSGNPYPGRIENDFTFPNATGACSLIFYAKFNKHGVFQYIKRPQPPTDSSNAVSNTASWNFEIYNDILYWFTWLPPGSYADGSFVNSNPDTYTPYVLKYNIDGSFIEAIQLGTIQTFNSIRINYYINPNNDNYYTTIVKEGSSSTVSINGQSIVNSAVLACFDGTGQFLWKRENTITTPNALKFYGIDFDAQNNIYIAGLIAPMNFDSFIGFSNPNPTNSAFVMKTNPTADTALWASNHNSSGATTYAALLYNGSEVAFTNHCFGTSFTWGSQTLNVSSSSNQGTEVLLARFDSATGDCLSLNKIPGDVGYDDNGTALAVDASGDYLVGGGFGHYLYDVNSNQVVNEGGQSDFFIAKFATASCQPLSNASFESDTILVYPNPVQEVLTVAIKEASRYSLYSVTGVLLQQGTVNTTNNTIAIAHLASGYYIVKLQTASGKVATVEVLKE